MDAGLRKAKHDQDLDFNAPPGAKHIDCELCGTGKGAPMDAEQELRALAEKLANEIDAGVEDEGIVLYDHVLYVGERVLRDSGLLELLKAGQSMREYHIGIGVEEWDAAWQQLSKFLGKEPK